MRLNVRIVSDRAVQNVGEEVCGTVKASHPTKGLVVDGRVRLELRTPGDKDTIAAVDGVTDAQGCFRFKLPRPAGPTSVLILRARVEAEGIDGDARTTIVTLIEGNGKQDDGEATGQRRLKTWIAVVLLCGALIVGGLILLSSKKPDEKPAGSAHAAAVQEEPVRKAPAPHGPAVLYILTKPSKLEVIHAKTGKTLGISPVITNVSLKDLPLRVRIKRGTWLSRPVKVPVRFDGSGSAQFEIDVNALREAEADSTMAARAAARPQPRKPRKPRPAIRRVVRPIRKPAVALKKPGALVLKKPGAAPKEGFGAAGKPVKPRSKPAIGTVGGKPVIGTLGGKTAIGPVGGPAGEKPAIGPLR